ncbi:MAG: HAMP domain-containing sensor histidine kinase [Nitrospirota bacterium]|nr:HAMP domain-containing sensor histidine kinase [Nitrospirota bacterium]
MFAKNKSILQKIKLGYIVSFLLILVIASIIFVNLIVIDERISFYAVISRFLDTTLEMRRFEKNYFLYRKKEDFAETLAYLRVAEELIQNNRGKFDGLLSSFYGDWPLGIFRKKKEPLPLSEKTSERSLNVLREYRELLKKDFAEQDPSKKPEARIRQKGREITEIAERLSEAERIKIQRMLSTTRKSLVVSVAVFLIGTVLIARTISRVAIQPLRELESSMRKIASGKFEMLSLNFEDKEIVSLNKAFNRMINEIFSQRDIIRSEKLTSLGTMLAGIAHEINNPLSNISTSAQILSEEIDSNEDREFREELIEQIIQETDRARDIVKSVLEFTRDRDFKKEEINLLNALRETLRFIRTDMPTYITIAIDIPEDLVILADKQKIQHVFLNLLRNAVDAIPDEGVEGKIIITARVDREKKEVEIRFSDTGRGIPEEIINKIFDPFFTTKDIGKGTGLGLYISHEIIKQHDGSIDLESRSGTGTTFIIKLPLKGDEDGKQDQTSDC